MEQKQLAQSLYERFNVGDIDRMVELLHPDIEWVNEPKDQYTQGKESLHAAWSQIGKIAKVHFDIVSSTPTEKGMFVVVQEKIWKPEDELIFDGPVGHDYTILDGKIRRCDIVDAYPEK